MAEGSPIRRIIAAGAVLVPLLTVACKDTAPKEQAGITQGDVYKKREIYEHRFFTSTPEAIRREVFIADCPARVLPRYENVQQECKTNAFLVPKSVYEEVKLGESVQAKENWFEVQSEIRR
jgi:hypothetical protein